MELLIEKSNLMQADSEAFQRLAFVHDDNAIRGNDDSLVSARQTILPMVRAHGRPALGSADRVVLTPREIKILELLGVGLSVKGAARELSISAGTVKWHVRNIFEKLGASSREGALIKARVRNILPKAALTTEINAELPERYGAHKRSVDVLTSQLNALAIKEQEIKALMTELREEISWICGGSAPPVAKPHRTI